MARIFVRIRLVVIRGETERRYRKHAVRHLLGRLRLNRIDTGEIVAREIQFLLRNFALGQARQNIHHEFGRVDRGFRARKRSHHERTCITMRSERRRSAVGESLLDADFGIQPAVVAAAENMIGHIQRNVIRIVPWDADFADANLSLHGVGLVNQPNVLSGAGAGRLRLGKRHVHLWPAAEILLGHGKGLFRRDVSREREQRLIRRVIGIVKFHEIAGLKFLDRGGRALRRQP